MTLTGAEGFTIADLEAMPDDGRRYELIGGSIVVNPAPTPRHQRASYRLHRLLAAAAPADHEVFSAPIDLDLPGGQRVEPDLVVVPHSSIGQKRLALPALLIVELVSPTGPLLDTTVKRAAYAEAAVEHYWLVDTRPGHDRFTALALAGHEYDTVFESTTEIDVAAPVPVVTRLTDLLEQSPTT